MGTGLSEREQSREASFPEQASSYPSPTLSFIKGRWFPYMPRAGKLSSPASTCAVSGLTLRHVSLQPLQVRSESMCLEDPSTNRDPGLVGSAPTSYALKTHAQWLLTGSVTKILFQKEGTTLALQTQQPLFIRACSPEEARKEHTGNVGDSFSD